LAEFDRGENYISRQAKAEAQATDREACLILAQWLAEARKLGQKQLVREIQKAQKFLGCRNKQKRKKR
jgi:hypothetical protein